MSRKKFGIAVLVAMTILAASAVAQEKKNELSGLIGRTFISDQGVTGEITSDPILHSGNGLTFQANYGRRLMGGGFAALTFEVPFVVNYDEKVHFSVNRVPEKYRSYFVTPSVRANIFAANAVSPWVSFGGGFGHFSESSTLEFGGLPNPGKTGTSTGIFQMGVGLDVKIWHAFSVRGEARDFFSGIPQLNVDTGKSRQHNIFAGGGVVWHF
jgi:hypothetical protein